MSLERGGALQARADRSLIPTSRSSGAPTGKYSCIVSGKSVDSPLRSTIHVRAHLLPYPWHRRNDRTASVVNRLTSWNLAVRQTSRGASWTPHIQESIRHYKNRNAGYFAEHLPSNQQWRLYWEFRTDARSWTSKRPDCPSTMRSPTAVLYDGRSIRHYVNGDNLDEFPRDVKEYALLVTYNGKTFDAPFIERFFHIQLPQAHIDLRYPLQSLGLKGGLKGCERQLGIARPGLEGVDGFFAPCCGRNTADGRTSRRWKLCWRTTFRIPSVSIHSWFMLTTKSCRRRHSPAATRYRLLHSPKSLFK